MAQNLQIPFSPGPHQMAQEMPAIRDQRYMDTQRPAERPANSGLTYCGPVHAGGAARAEGLKLGVVVPCRGDGELLEKCLQSLAPELQSADQVVVANCLGDARTQRAARRFGVRMIFPPGPSRGAAIVAGISALAFSGDSGAWRMRQPWRLPGVAEPMDWLLIAHADLVFPRGWRSRLEQAVRMNRQSQWGAFGHVIADQRRRFRLVEAGNAWRAVWWEIPYGDQAMFIKAGALSRIGGFPRQEKFEDLELSLRLKAIGPPLYLDYPVIIGSRHWKKGTVGRTMRNWWILAAYRFGWLGGGQLNMPAASMERSAGAKEIEA